MRSDVLVKLELLDNKHGTHGSTLIVSLSEFSTPAFQWQVIKLDFHRPRFRNLSVPADPENRGLVIELSV